MISIQLHDVQSAEPWDAPAACGVTFRFKDGSRVTFHTRTYSQAVALANAINAEEEARAELLAGVA